MSWKLLSILLLSGCLVEGTIRFNFGAPRAERLPLLRVMPDPQLGYRPVPGDTHYGYDLFTELNSLGMRGREVEAKKDNEYRIIALGETQLYGLGISDEDLVTQRLERELNLADPSKNYSAINFGVRAFALNQQANLLEEIYLTELKPDHVIVFIYIYSFNKANITQYFQRHKHLDWYMLDFDDKLETISHLKWRLTQFGRKIATIAWLHELYKTWKGREDLASRLLSGKMDADTEQRISYIQDQLSRLKTLVRKGGSSLTIAIIPLPSQLVRDYPNEVYFPSLRQIANMLKIPAIDFLSQFRTLYEKNGQLPVAPFDAHYNSEAHIVMATSLTAHILSQIRHKE